MQPCAGDLSRTGDDRGVPYFNTSRRYLTRRYKVKHPLAPLRGALDVSLYAVLTALLWELPNR
jgi:hypothetical protein